MVIYKKDADSYFSYLDQVNGKVEVRAKSVPVENISRLERLRKEMREYSAKLNNEVLQNAG